MARWDNRRYAAPENLGDSVNTAAGEIEPWISPDGDGSPLGDAAPSRLSPYPVTGGHQFATVTTGNAHSCGVTTAGQGHCWGGNNAGQLGDGTQVTTSTPSAVVGPS